MSNYPSSNDTQDDSRLNSKLNALRAKGYVIALTSSINGCDEMVSAIYSCNFTMMEKAQRIARKVSKRDAHLGVTYRLSTMPNEKAQVMASIRATAY